MLINRPPAPKWPKQGFFMPTYRENLLHATYENYGRTPKNVEYKPKRYDTNLFNSVNFKEKLKSFSLTNHPIKNAELPKKYDLSKLELCQEIKKCIPDFYFVEAQFGKDLDQRDYSISNEKIQKCNFKAAVSLPEGIAELIKGYQIIRRNQFSNA